jgi:hypothetical protein
MRSETAGLTVVLYIRDRFLLFTFHLSPFTYSGASFPLNEDRFLAKYEISNFISQIIKIKTCDRIDAPRIGAN